MLAATAIAMMPLGALLAPATASAATTAACTGGVAVNQFYFNPVTVSAGQTSAATLVLRNCTSQTIPGTTIWSGIFSGLVGEAPPGCPVIDPIGFPYSIAPGGTFTQTEQEGDTIPGCQANGLLSTVNVNVDRVTGTVATAKASLSIVQPTSPPPPPPSTCHVSYQPSSWGGGFTANVTINNTGTTAISNWTLTFAFQGDQKITTAWNATVSQSGENVSATNESYNATIAAGGSQSFGFQGTWSSSNAAPLTFSLNGSACT